MPAAALTAPRAAPLRADASEHRPLERSARPVRGRASVRAGRGHAVRPRCAAQHVAAPSGARGRGSRSACAADAGRDGVQASRVLLVGGTGKIGVAAAAHLLRTDPAICVTLAGRSAEGRKGAAAAYEAAMAAGGPADSCRVGTLRLELACSDELEAAVRGYDAVLHTAGPFGEDDTSLLEACIAAGVPCYCDVADPISYLKKARSEAMNAKAAKSGTMALCAAGAFPGLSNLLAAKMARGGGMPSAVQDVDFSYFTAGLGGSGAVNLLITNLGFGALLPRFRSGAYAPERKAGVGGGQVDFFLTEDDASFRRVGTRDVWPWPFPEAATVAEHLHIRGNSNASMGTAPDIWNGVMRVMCEVLPRDWWADERFSGALADFSRPLVALTDAFVGETHCMRVDVTFEDGARASAVQGHESFRSCVGQSLAEFALELLARRGTPLFAPGVRCPEEVFAADEAVDGGQAADALLERLCSTPGTFTYSTRVVGAAHPAEVKA